MISSNPFSSVNRSTTDAPPPQRYIVRRHFEGPDMGPMSSGSSGYDRYVATESPNAGEKIYHGPFRREADYGDQKFDQPSYYYVPVDPEQITWEIFRGGKAGGDVEVF